MKKLFLVVSLVLLSVGFAFAQNKTEADLLTVSTTTSTQTELISGATTVTLSNDFLGALTALNLTPGTVFPATLRGTHVSFPITDGTLDNTTLRGEIVHNGGLTLKRGSTDVKLKSFIIDTTGEGIILTGLVSANGSVVGRIPLFDLTLPSNFGHFIRLKRVNLNNVAVTLRPEAAAALNGVFGTTAFVAGFNIGEARVRGIGYAD